MKKHILWAAVLVLAIGSLSASGGVIQVGNAYVLTFAEEGDHAKLSGTTTNLTAGVDFTALSGYDPAPSPAGLQITTGYSRGGRVGSSAGDTPNFVDGYDVRMTLTADSLTDTARVSLVFANATTTSSEAGFGTSVGIASSTWNGYMSNSLKVAFVNDGTSARSGRLMYGLAGTAGGQYLDFAGRTALDNTVLDNGAWHRIVGYFEKTDTADTWNVTVELWNLFDDTLVDSVSQAAILHNNTWAAPSVVAGMSLNRSSGLYSQDLTWEAIPEPATIGLLAIGLVAARLLRRRRA